MTAGSWKNRPNLLLGGPAIALLLSLSIWLIGLREAAALDAKYGINAGYRTDSLNWNIASDLSGTVTPNIQSELTWSAIHIAQLSGGFQLTATDGLQIRGMADYGWIQSGQNQDSDYSGNNRTLEYSRSNNDTTGDNVQDLSVALGYQFHFSEDGNAAYLTPLVGLSRSEQNLRISNGFQTIPATGPIQGLNSTYQARWTGPWVGIEFLTDTKSDFNGYLRLEHHWANYSAEANWNLRADLQHPVSFEQYSNGTGNILSLGVLMVPKSSKWSFHVGLDFQRWNTDPGTNQEFFSNGTTSITRLNNVEWKSWALSLGLRRSL